MDIDQISFQLKRIFIAHLFHHQDKIHLCRFMCSNLKQVQLKYEFCLEMFKSKFLVILLINVSFNSVVASQVDNGLCDKHLLALSEAIETNETWALKRKIS